MNNLDRIYFANENLKKEIKELEKININLICVLVVLVVVNVTLVLTIVVS